jgi:putative SOS response-associated peptidase YedK
MCGRYSFTADLDQTLAHFQAVPLVRLEPRYNIAPTQPIPVVRENLDNHQCELTLMHWGLIPSWSKDPNIGARLINARSETVAEKPSFRNAFRRRRCLIPATGFYEWQKLTKGKQPFNCCRDDSSLFALAGLWETWQGPNGEEIESCTILTKAADELMQPIHDRMPVVVPPAEYQSWLDAQTNPVHLNALIKAATLQGMVLYPVSAKVNRAQYDAPDCLEPLSS